MLRHFRVPFSIVHDVDWPFKRDGTANGMWTINQSIHDAIVTCREVGIIVRHRCSVPDFERTIGGDSLGKDKPLSAYRRVTEDAALREKLQQFFVDICDGKEQEPFGPIPDGTSYIAKVSVALRSWNDVYGTPNDIRLLGKETPPRIGA